MSDLYGPASEQPATVSVIDAPVGRKLNNALTMKFLEGGAEEPFATAQQGAGDGTGKKLGILFGFKNGGVGAHVVTYADGSTLTVPTVVDGPTLLTRGDGSAVATVTRGETTTATAPDGGVLMSFLPDPVEAKADWHYRIRVTDAAGAHVATMDVILPGGRYNTGDLVEALDLVTSGFQSAPGGALPIHVVGVRTMLHRELTPLERDLVVAASIELGISVRPYIAAMS